MPRRWGVFRKADMSGAFMCVELLAGAGSLQTTAWIQRQQRKPEVLLRAVSKRY